MLSGLSVVVMIIIIICCHVCSAIRGPLLLNCSVSIKVGFSGPAHLKKTFLFPHLLDLKALKMIQSMLKPSLLLQKILCDHSIMMNKRRTNKETFSGTFLYLPCVSLPHVCGNVPTVQILAGFSLFVFLPLYVPAAGLLGLLP